MPNSNRPDSPTGGAGGGGSRGGYGTTRGAGSSRTSSTRTSPRVGKPAKKTTTKTYKGEISKDVSFKKAHQRFGRKEGYGKEEGVQPAGKLAKAGITKPKPLPKNISKKVFEKPIVRDGQPAKSIVSAKTKYQMNQAQRATNLKAKKMKGK